MRTMPRRSLAFESSEKLDISESSGPPLIRSRQESAARLTDPSGRNERKSLTRDYPSYAGSFEPGHSGRGTDWR